MLFFHIIEIIWYLFKVMVMCSFSPCSSLTKIIYIFLEHFLCFGDNISIISCSMRINVFKNMLFALDGCSWDRYHFHCIQPLHSISFCGMLLLGSYASLFLQDACYHGCHGACFGWQSGGWCTIWFESQNWKVYHIL